MSNSSTDNAKSDIRSPFHAHEKDIQTRAGVSTAFEQKTQALIREVMPDQHRQFFESLPFIIISLVDHQGQPWVLPISGSIGFIRSPDAHTLIIHKLPPLIHYLSLHLETGTKIGLLGIELPTRRRNRMNGIIQAIDAHSMSIRVEQSFGNCPKYIQRRDIVENLHQAKDHKTSTIHRMTTLDSTAKKMIESADTLFIGSRSKILDDDVRHGLDASHRGGLAGFVKVIDDHTLCFPDYAGNRFFNTLGNIAADGRVGLFFIDFATGHSLLLSGHAEISWDDPSIEQLKGAERLISINTQHILWVEHFFPFTSRFIEYSRILNKTNTWNNL